MALLKSKKVEIFNLADFFTKPLFVAQLHVPQKLLFGW